MSSIASTISTGGYLEQSPAGGEDRKLPAASLYCPLLDTLAQYKAIGVTIRGLIHYKKTYNSAYQCEACGGTGTERLWDSTCGYSDGFCPDCGGDGLSLEGAKALGVSLYPHPYGEPGRGRA